PLVGVEEATARPKVLVAGAERVCRRGPRHAGTGRSAERHRPRARLHQEFIRVAVIAALERDDLVASRRRPGHAHDAHGRLGAGADEPYALERGHQAPDALTQLDFENIRRSIARPELGP